MFYEAVGAWADDAADDSGESEAGRVADAFEEGHDVAGDARCECFRRRSLKDEVFEPVAVGA